MNKYKYDLHIHSCLSPCGDMDMTPNNIVNMASIIGCDIIAVTDHNSCANLPVIMEIAKKMGITCVPGMELCTAEEAHVLCYFLTLEGAMSFSEYVYEQSPNIENKEHIFGAQVIMNEQDEPIDKVDKMLINATNISAYELTELLIPYGGIAVPAHIDKSSYSLMASLGSIPPEYGFSCVELSDNCEIEAFLNDHPDIKEMGILRDSDAHYLENFKDELPEMTLEKNDVRSVITAIKGGKF